MKRIIIILILILTLNSCFLFMPPGAPHGHSFEDIDNPNSQIGVSIMCTQGKKYYRISGIEKNDSVNISSNKIKRAKSFYLSNSYSTDSSKLYYLRIGDFNFHRKLLDDTVKVNVIKPNSDISTYKFLVTKDSYIKN